MLSLPEATWTGREPSVTVEPLHVPPVPPVIDVHRAVAAVTGTSVQPVKDPAAALTPTFQVLAVAPPETRQETDPVPETAAASGSLKVKLTVPGDTDVLEIEEASGSTIACVDRGADCTFASCPTSPLNAINPHARPPIIAA